MLGLTGYDMATMNQEYFDRPESLRIALGELVSNHPEAKGWQILGPNGEVMISGTNGGIVSPRPITIQPSTTLIRFGNAPFASEVAGGGWWLDWVNYKIVERHADAKGSSVSAEMRNLCAVPVEWSSMTMLIQVTTRSPLSAFLGRGKVATAISKLGIRSTIDPMRHGSPPVEQLYIPGLSSPDLRKSSVLVTGYAMHPEGETTKGYAPSQELAR